MTASPAEHEVGLTERIAAVEQRLTEAARRPIRLRWQGVVLLPWDSPWQLGPGDCGRDRLGRQRSGRTAVVGLRHRAVRRLLHWIAASVHPVTAHARRKRATGGAYETQPPPWGGQWAATSVSLLGSARVRVGLRPPRSGTAGSHVLHDRHVRTHRIACHVRGGSDTYTCFSSMTSRSR